MKRILSCLDKLINCPNKMLSCANKYYLVNTLYFCRQRIILCGQDMFIILFEILKMKPACPFIGSVVFWHITQYSIVLRNVLHFKMDVLFTYRLSRCIASPIRLHVRPTKTQSSTACAAVQSDQIFVGTLWVAMDPTLLLDADAQADLSLRWAHMQSCRKCCARTQMRNDIE